MNELLPLTVISKLEKRRKINERNSRMPHFQSFLRFNGLLKMFQFFLSLLLFKNETLYLFGRRRNAYCPLAQNMERHNYDELSVLGPKVCSFFLLRFHTSHNQLKHHFNAGDVLMMYCIQHSIVNGEKNYISQAVDSVQLESTRIKEYAENRIKGK